MILRGQGDSPVRICEPCKKLEEAARFEMRHGHKNKAGKGSSKLTAKCENEVLFQILVGDEKESSSAGQTSKNQSVDDDMQNETTSASPEELRQRTMDEKKNYKILKEEGKPEEALRAFKKGKELQRQANALEISIRKNRKKVLQSGSIAEIPSEALSSEILLLKREARNQKRAGNVSEAVAQLEKAKLLERDLKNFDSQGDDRTPQTADRSLGSGKTGEENFSSESNMDLKPFFLNRKD